MSKKRGPKTPKDDNKSLDEVTEVVEELETVPEVDNDSLVKTLPARFKMIAIILGIVAVGSLITYGVAVLLDKNNDSVVVTEPEIPFSSLLPAIPLTANDVSVVLEDSEAVIEEVLVVATTLDEPKLLPPDVPSYGVSPGFDCAFIIGGWSDAILLDAKDRNCDVVVMDYLGDIVYYYDVGFDIMQNISHRYH